MHDTSRGAAITYAAVIDNVKEVMLLGRADLHYWATHLKSADLVPYDDNRAAQISITGTELRWMGIKFRELTISVAASSHEDGHIHEGYFLAHAYNSSPVLALMERVFFHTPYYHATIHVEGLNPAHIRLREKQETLFEARMSERTSLAEHADVCWAGPIFLPRRRSADKRPGEYFHARLEGPLESYPFEPASDTFELPRTHDQAWDWLAQSSFTPSEWRIRRNAKHSKSKTYRRPAR